MLIPSGFSRKKMEKTNLTNPVIEAIKKRRSIRKYQSKKIPKEIIEQILECGAYAPSAMRIFPWNFIVIENKEKIRKLSNKSKETLHLLGFGMKFAERVTSKDDMIFYNAPLVVIITCDKNVKWKKEDTALAAQNMFLAAQSLGLGSCWIGLADGLGKDEKTRKDLSIPENHEITAVLIFGYPAEEKPAQERKAKILKWVE